MGRKPKADPAIHRYGIKLTNEENVRFEAAFSESGMKEKAGFIKKSIFGGRIKVVKIDKATICLLYTSHCSSCLSSSPDCSAVPECHSEASVPEAWQAGC